MKFAYINSAETENHRDLRAVYMEEGISMNTHKFDEQSVKECADILVQSVNQIRKDNDISENQDISIYVIDAPIVHSAVSQFGKHIQERTNAHSIVQVNLDAGNPMPEALPQIEVTIGDDPVVIAVEQV